MTAFFGQHLVFDVDGGSARLFQFPDRAHGIQREIEENRDVLEPFESPQRHFCYPSGLWSAHQLSILRSLGIKSATTCDIGMNGPKQDPLLLRRFLDGEQVTQIRFEAEMSGLMDLVRASVSALSNMRSALARALYPMSRRLQPLGRPLSFLFRK